MVGGTVLAPEEWWNPAIDWFSFAGSLEHARHWGHTATLLPDGRVLITGGIGPDDPGSGASATYAYLQDMDPSFARTKPAFVDTIEALLQIKVAGKYTDLKAAMLVQRPTTRSAPVTVLLENPKDYRLIPVSEADIENSKLPDGSVVYTFEQVNIGETSGKNSLDVNTICTRGLLLASKRKLGRDLRSKLSAVMLESATTVIGEDE